MSHRYPASQLHTSDHSLAIVVVSTSALSSVELTFDLSLLQLTDGACVRVCVFICLCACALRARLHRVSCEMLRCALL